MGDNRLMQDLYEENQRLKARIEELESKHFVECTQIAQYSDELNEVNSYTEIVEDMATKQTISGMSKSDELRKAKELLRAAVDDMYNSVNDVHCKYCNKWHTDQCQGTSHLDCYVENKFKWRYADEALALIGGSENG